MTYITALTSTSGTTDQTVEEVIDSATEVTAEAGQEVNQFFQMFQDNLPDIIAFGIRVVFAFVFFVVGSKVISWIRKLVRRSMERAEADMGVRQFVDSFLKSTAVRGFVFEVRTVCDPDLLHCHKIRRGTVFCRGFDRFSRSCGRPGAKGESF